MAPAGEPYDWYQRAQALLAAGSPGPAIELLERVLAAEPGSGSVAELLARALFDAGRYRESLARFEAISAGHPDDDYALFGRGLACARLGLFRQAAGLLGAAATMRPESADYRAALVQVEATLRARRGTP